MAREYGKCAAQSGAVYGLGLIGAAVYFISHAAGFWLGVLGFLKALVWPAILVYELLKQPANAEKEYQLIKDNYPKSSEATDIDKYLARVQK